MNPGNVNGCEVRIENSVTRVAVLHHQGHQVTEFSFHT